MLDGDYDLPHGRPAPQEVERLGQLLKCEGLTDGGRALAEAASREHLIQLARQLVLAIRQPVTGSSRTCDLSKLHWNWLGGQADRGLDSFGLYHTRLKPKRAIFLGTSSPGSTFGRSR